MSQGNVELFNKALEGYNRRDIRPMLETLHPEAEWYPFTAQVEGDEAYQGPEGVRQWWANLDATLRSSRRASMSFEISAIPFWDLAAPAFPPGRRRRPAIRGASTQRLRERLRRRFRRLRDRRFVVCE